MARRFKSIFLVCALFVLIVPASAGSAEIGRYIVILHDDAGDPARVARDHALSFGAQVGHIYRYALRGYSATVDSDSVASIRQDARVRWVQEDERVELGEVSRATGRVASVTASQVVPEGVDRIDAEGKSGSFPGVAVIDTGVDIDHPDLNVVGGTDCTGSGTMNDGNGHGTHVAGTIGARDNGIGVVGVAPGAPIYAVRVLNAAGFGFTSWINCGIDWVAANASSLNIKVVNMSLGGRGQDDGRCGLDNRDSQHRAICLASRAGATFVVAAGNDARDLSSSTPAAYNVVLTVTAMADFNGQPGGGAPATCRQDVDETPADFSNFTTPVSADAKHTIAAPGVCIHSTWIGGTYDTISGTSMASPHVAGVAALCIAAGQCGGNPNVRTILPALLSTAASRPASYGFTGDAHGTLNNRYYGYLTYAGGY